MKKCFNLKNFLHSGVISFVVYLSQIMRWINSTRFKYDFEIFPVTWVLSQFRFWLCAHQGFWAVIDIHMIPYNCQTDFCCHYRYIIFHYRANLLIARYNWKDLADKPNLSISHFFFRALMEFVWFIRQQTFPYQNSSIELRLFLLILTCVNNKWKKHFVPKPWTSPMERIISGKSVRCHHSITLTWSCHLSEQAK